MGHGPAAAGRLAHRGYQPLAGVAHHRLAVVGNAQGRQLFGNPAGVAIGDVAKQQLGADAEDFGSHLIRAPGWKVAVARHDGC